VSQLGHGDTGRKSDHPIDAGPQLVVGIRTAPGGYIK
jgi:hypothetical protein